MKAEHKRGRTKKYRTKEEMNIKINEYFESCFEPLFNKDGDLVRDEKRTNN